MTVQELINILSELPKDKKVYTDKIKENFRGEIVLTHEDIHEEEQKREEEIARRDREWEEEMERGRDMPTFVTLNIMLNCLKKISDYDTRRRNKTKCKMEG